MTFGTAPQNIRELTEFFLICIFIGILGTCPLYIWGELVVESIFYWLWFLGVLILAMVLIGFQNRKWKQSRIMKGDNKND
jgi:hypothetical protein